MKNRPQKRKRTALRKNIENPKTIGQRLKLARATRGYTQSKFAFLLDTALSTYRKYEQDIINIPDHIKIRLLDFNISIDWLLTGREESLYHQELNPKEEEKLSKLVVKMEENLEEMKTIVFLNSISKQTVISEEESLRKKVVPQKGRDKEILSINEDYIKKVPLIGQTAAGDAIDIYNWNEDVLVPGYFIRKDLSKYYCLRVTGTSMTEIGIQDGDIVLIEETNQLNNYEVGVFSYQNTSHLKRLHIDYEKQESYLEWCDGSNRKVQVRDNDYKIVGKFLTVIDQD